MLKKFFELLPILAVFLFAFFLRWWVIDSVAPGISIDELEYVITAKSFYLTGTDLAGKTHTWDSLRFVYPSTDSIKAELPFWIDMFFDGPFPFSLPLARLPYVLLSTGIVLLLYGIGKELFDKTTGVTAAILGAINPFLVISGRTMYEIVPSTFFYFLGLYVLIKARGRTILIAIPVFICAFYAYIGTKLLFMPFILVAAYFSYVYIHKKKDGKYFFIVGIFAVAIVLGYFILLRFNHSGARLGELLLPNSSQITKAVDNYRKGSMATFLTPVIFNKGTVYINTIIDGLFSNFSSGPLFIYSDGFFHVYNFGVFYYLDALFILAGFYFLFSKNIKTGAFFIILLLISTIPQVFHNSGDTGPSFTHTALIFPLLILIVATGIVNFMCVMRKKKMFVPVAISIVSIYAFLFLAFFQTYFYQYPMVGKDDFPSRMLARYITFAGKEGKSVDVLSPQSSENFRKYLFYTNGITKNSIAQIKKAFISGNIRLNNVAFLSCAKYPSYPKNTIVIKSDQCAGANKLPYSTIPLIADGGSAYNIYPDNVCSGYKLKRFPDHLSLSLLQVENLSKKQFCETFITQLNIPGT